MTKNRHGMKFGKFALIVMMLLSSASWGKRVDALYDARTLVQNQTLDVRKEAAKAGLTEVLVRLSGSELPEENAAINSALEIADQYLYQFSYSKLESHEWSESSPPGSSWLNMRFEGRALTRILRSAELPIWGAERPTMLVWLAVGTGGGERLVITEGSDHPALHAIREATRQRGVPLILPVYDLEDSMQLPSESLWGLFSDVIQTASQRYSPESVLAGRVYKTADGRWFGHWKFLFRGEEKSFVYHADSLDEHVLTGVSHSAEALANVFAIKPSQGRTDTVTLVIHGVDDLEQYARVSNYLQKLTTVKQVAITGLKKTDLSLELKLASQYHQFEQALKLDRKLEPQADAPIAKSTGDGSSNGTATAADSTTSQVKHFRWRP